jgi:hypothetical protein
LKRSAGVSDHAPRSFRREAGWTSLSDWSGMNTEERATCKLASRIFGPLANCELKTTGQRVNRELKNTGRGLWAERPAAPGRGSIRFEKSPRRMDPTLASTSLDPVFVSFTRLCA